MAALVIEATPLPAGSGQPSGDGEDESERRLQWAPSGCYQPPEAKECEWYLNVICHGTLRLLIKEANNQGSEGVPSNDYMALGTVGVAPRGGSSLYPFLQVQSSVLGQFRAADVLSLIHI